MEEKSKESKFVTITLQSMLDILSLSGPLICFNALILNKIHRCSPVSYLYLLKCCEENIYIFNKFVCYRTIIYLRPVRNCGHLAES